MVFTLKQLLHNPRTVRTANKAEQRMLEQRRRKESKMRVVQRQELALLLGGVSGSDQRGFSELVRGMAARDGKR